QPAAGHLLAGLHQEPGLECGTGASDGLQRLHVRLLESAAGLAQHVRREHRRWTVSNGNGSSGSPQYDVVIVGAGVSGNLIALQLGLAGKKVLMLEAGPAVPDSREEYMNNFYLALAKTPESPYPALAGRTGPGIGKLENPDTLPTPRATVLMIGQSPDVSHLIQSQTAGVPVDPKNPDSDVRQLQFSSTYE